MRKLTAVSAVRRAIQRCRWRLFHTWNLRELSRTLLPSDLRKAAGSRGVRVVRVRGQQSESLCYFLRMFKAGDKKRVFVFFSSWVYYILSFPSSGRTSSLRPCAVRLGLQEPCLASANMDEWDFDPSLEKGYRLQEHVRHISCMPGMPACSALAV